MESDLPEVPCEKTYTHEPHEWIMYDIDKNIDERVWCTGNFLTVEKEK